MDNNELQHAGIKGMKWGRRRYQNPDGTWTALGKARRREGDDDNSSSKKDSEHKKLKDTSTTVNKTSGKGNDSKPKEDPDKKPEETIEQKKERILRSKSAEDIYNNSHLFTDQELNNAANRLSTEARIRALIPAKKPGLKDKIASSLKSTVVPPLIDAGKKALTKALESKLGLKDPKDPIKEISDMGKATDVANKLKSLTGLDYGPVFRDALSSKGIKGVETPKSALSRAKEIIGKNNETKQRITELENLNSSNPEILNLIEELKRGI